MNGRYNLLQIGLHWLIAFLVPIQYLTGGSIERTHHAAHMGMVPSDWDILQHHVHNYSGMSIGVLMTARLLIRFLSPPTPIYSRSRAVIAAQLLHFGFYAAIIVQAALGFVASYIWFGVAPWHVVIARIILGMVAIHFLAAVWHTLIRKDETLDRMVVPRRSAASDQERGQSERNIVAGLRNSTPGPQKDDRNGPATTGNRINESGIRDGVPSPQK